MNEENVAQILELLQQNRELLDKLSSSVPDAKYYKESGETSATFKKYLDGLEEKETADVEQASRIEEILKSIDEKIIVDETPALSAEMYAETNEEIVATLTQLNDQMSATTAHLQNIENIQIPMLCGVGMIFGVVCTVILSRFMHH